MSGTRRSRTLWAGASGTRERLIDQLELQLEELAAAAAEDATKAETARVHVAGFTRRQATRRNFPEHLPLVHQYDQQPEVPVCRARD